MKISKFGLAVLALALVVLAPTTSLSKDNAPSSVVLSKDNLIILNSEVNGESTAQVISKAKELDAAMAASLGEKVGAKKPIYLFLNTPGGSIQSGLEMIEALQGLGRPVHTITLFAASMGFQIAQNLSDRLIIKNGVLMSHHAAGEFQGSFGGVQPSQVDSRYQLWLDRMRELDEQTVKRTKGKQTYESYTKQYDHEMWLTGTKSVDQGYADQIVLVKCDPSLAGATTHTLQAFGALIDYDLDNCPINTSPLNIRIQQSAAHVPYTTAEVQDLRGRFLELFNNKQKQVVPMYW